MKKITCLAAFAFIVLLSHSGFSQQSLKEKIIRDGELEDANDKKFHVGISFNQYFSSIYGETQATYFIKPSIGFNFRAEYYFNKWLGIGLGVGFQQRGAGINGTDVTGGAFSHPWVFVNTPEGYRSGDPDSTHLERLRFSTIEFPLTILIRTPKDFLQQGMRLSGAVGPTLIHMSRVNQTYQSIIDGFHPYNFVTENYERNQFGIQGSIGFDIDSGGGGSLFQVHFVYTETFTNLYANGVANGTQWTAGVRLGYMF
ncbi:MAG: outer membrane beta-barrel protein [Cyclobacteriaceae bacterium]|nr:outer membrane beta-barrel protein [Cyclobacteriaceae bacterium]